MSLLELFYKRTESWEKSSLFHRWVSKTRDRSWFGWRGVVKTLIRIMYPERKTGPSGTLKQKVPQGKWVFKGECKRRRKESKRGPKTSQVLHYSEPYLHNLCWGTSGMPLPAFSVLIPPQPHFFNEIGQLNKGQISELKQISLGLAWVSFNRSLKPWASTNRIDASVGEKKYEKDKEERVYMLQMTHTRKSIWILLMNTATYHVAQLQMDPSRPAPNDKNRNEARPPIALSAECKTISRVLGSEVTIPNGSLLHPVHIWAGEKSPLLFDLFSSQLKDHHLFAFPAPIHFMKAHSFSLNHVFTKHWGEVCLLCTMYSGNIIGTEINKTQSLPCRSSVWNRRDIEQQQ